MGTPLSAKVILVSALAEEEGEETEERGKVGCKLGGSNAALEDENDLGDDGRRDEGDDTIKAART